MTVSVKYAFTVTLLPKIYRYPAEKQYDLTYLHIMRILDGLSHAYTLIGELTRQSNLHYHGVIQYYNIKARDNLIKKWNDAFRGSQYVGHTMIKQMDNEKGWVDYIAKELPTTKEALNRPPILNDHFNYIISSMDDFVLQSGYIQYDNHDEQ